MSAPKTEGKRRSLAGLGGAVTAEGEASLAEILKQALSVPPGSMDSERDRRHVHGFHSYPARMHPDTASRLVRGLTEPGETVLDPFCGSGTVLVEAMILGRKALGSDLNPLAVRLANLKTFPLSDDALDELIRVAEEARAHADEARKAKRGAGKRLPGADVALFEPHILLELGTLQGFIQTAPPRQRPTLELILSSMLTKMSRRTGDTSEGTSEKRLAAGFPSRFFVRKAEELASQMRSFRALLPNPPPRARVLCKDARDLGGLGPAHAIVSSPPYAGTYDYLEHHRMRLRWLGLPWGTFESGELGARRRYKSLSAQDAAKTWTDELSAFLNSAYDALVARGRAALVISDSVVGKCPIRADAVIETVATASGFSLLAKASQARDAHFSRDVFRDEPPREHILLLEKGRKSGYAGARHAHDRVRNAEKSTQRDRRTGRRPPH